MSVFKTIVCGLALLLCSAEAMSQAARSPLSSFGIGDYHGNATSHSQGMAGVGVSNGQYLFINNVNPALLIYNGIGGITSFQAGILGEQRTMSNGSAKETANGANLNYMVLAFPIKSGKWVTSVGLMPYSSTRYRYSYTERVTGTQDTATFVESGRGGINQVAWSNGIALHKWLSLGVKASYLYSTIENSFANTVLLDNQVAYFTPDVRQRYYYSGFQFTGGISLHIDSLFNDNYKINFGAVYDFQTDLNTDYLQTLIRTTQGSIDISTDTLVTNTSGTTGIPSATSLGVSFGRGSQWVFAVDARFTDYTKFAFLENQQTPTTKGWRVAAGFELTPNPGSLTSYLKNVTYRTGVSLEESPYLVNGNPLRDFGTNFGLSLPVARGCSIDLSGRWGRRGNIATNTIEENYFKLYFGVTFNDRWFIKRRFD